LKIHTEIRVQKTSEIEQTSAAPTSCEAEHKDDKLAGIKCTLYTVQYIYDAKDKTFRHLGYIYRYYLVNCSSGSHLRIELQIRGKSDDLHASCQDSGCIVQPNELSVRLLHNKTGRY
jgi:hypothetical protein